jgi:nucleoside phosphorylase
MHDVLICAAMGSEFKACTHGIKDSGLGSHFEVLRTGIGMKSASQALERRLRSGSRPKLIVSSGFAGALTKDIPLHAWISADKIWSCTKEFSEIPGNYLALQKSLATQIVSVETIAQHEFPIKEKLSVDMETAALAEVANRQGIRFMVLRLISDTADHPLPEFASAFVSAITEKELPKKLAHGLRGLRLVAGNPRGVASLLLNGPKWAELLRNGLSERCEAILKLSQQSSSSHQTAASHSS